MEPLQECHLRSLTFVAPKHLEWREATAPVIQAAGDALLRPVAATNCDLDQAIVRGLTPFQGPFAIGHECVAEVIEIGTEAGALVPGQLVCVLWNLGCEACDRCVPDSARVAVFSPLRHLRFAHRRVMGRAFR